MTEILCINKTVKYLYTIKIVSFKSVPAVKGRYIVENTNTWIKDYRRVNNRYEQKALNYEQIIFFSINNIILNKFKNLSFIDYEFKIELYGVNI